MQLNVIGEQIDKNCFQFVSGYTLFVRLFDYFNVAAIWLNTDQHYTLRYLGWPSDLHNVVYNGDLYFNQIGLALSLIPTPIPLLPFDFIITSKS